MNTIKIWFLLAYYRFLGQPRAVIISFLISSIPMLASYYGLHLLLQLTQMPFDIIRQVEAVVIIVVALPIVKSFFDKCLRFFSSVDINACFDSFESAESKEDKDKSLKQIATSLFVSPEYFSYQLNGLLIDDDLFKQNVNVIKQEFFSGYQHAASLEEAIQNYAEVYTSAVLTEKCVNAEISVHLSADHKFFELFKLYVHRHYDAVINKFCLPYCKEAIASFVKKNIKREELDFAKGSEEQKKQIIKKIMEANRVPSDDQYAFEFNEAFTNNPLPFVGNAAVKEEFLSFCRQSSFLLSETIQEYAKLSAGFFVIAKLKEAIGPFEQLKQGCFFEEHVKANFSTAIAACIPHFEKATNLLVKSIKAEVKEALDKGFINAMAEFGGEIPYVILDIKFSRSGAAPSLEKIKEAYYNKSLEYHPDKNFDEDVGKERFQKIRAAYDFLLDLKKRARLNKELNLNEEKKEEKEEIENLSSANRLLFQFGQGSEPSAAGSSENEIPLSPRRISPKFSGRMSELD